jgi:hypothetical protein
MLSGTARARAGKDYWAVQNSWSANWGNPPTRARALACTYARATTAHAHDTRHSQRMHARQSRRGGAVCAVRAGEGGFARIARGKDTMGIESLELLTVHADTTEAFAHSHAALPPAPPLWRYPPPAASPALRSLPLCHDPRRHPPSRVCSASSADLTVRWRWPVGLRVQAHLCQRRQLYARVPLRVPRTVDRRDVRVRLSPPV